MSKRRDGKVISIRISRMDCLSIIDVCNKAGHKVGTTFPSIASQALKLMLQAYREAEVIPERDGFEWADMMGPYLDNDEKLVERNARRLMAPALPRYDRPEEYKPIVNDELESLAAVRLAVGVDSDGWSAEREERYQELMRLHQPS